MPVVPVPVMAFRQLVFSPALAVFLVVFPRLTPIFCENGKICYNGIGGQQKSCYLYATYSNVRTTFTTLIGINLYNVNICFDVD